MQAFLSMEFRSLQNLLTLDAPERGEGKTQVMVEDVSRYRNTEYGFSIEPLPHNQWMLQGGTGADQPVLLALGVAKDGVTPAITFEALETTELMLDRSDAELAYEGEQNDDVKVQFYFRSGMIHMKRGNNELAINN